MAKACLIKAPTPPPTVNLSLTLPEAATLMAVLAKIGGPYEGPRGLTNGVLKALQLAVVNGHEDWPVNSDLGYTALGEGSIFYTLEDLAQLDKFVSELRL